MGVHQNVLSLTVLFREKQFRRVRNAATSMIENSAYVSACWMQGLLEYERLVFTSMCTVRFP